MEKVNNDRDGVFNYFWRGEIWEKEGWEGNRVDVVGKEKLLVSMIEINEKLFLHSLFS